MSSIPDAELFKILATHWKLRFMEYRYKVKVWEIKHPNPTLRELRQFDAWKLKHNPSLREDFKAFALKYTPEQVAEALQ